MCGLAGGILGQTPRTADGYRQITQIFSRLLRLNQARGPYATGVGCIHIDGSVFLEKAPISANAFVRCSAYRTWCQHIGPDTTLLMGHTRWPTQGSHHDNSNNHPLFIASEILVTHNGHLPHVERYFARFALPRTTEVDSELIGQLAYRHLTPHGVDLRGFFHAMTCCPGQLTAVCVARSHPTQIIIMRRDRPLWFAYHQHLDVLFYTSERQAFLMALDAPHAWTIWAPASDTAYLASCQRLTSLEAFPFSISAE